MSVPVIHHPDYDAASVGPDHRFPMRKYSALARRLMLDGLVAPGGFVVPEAAGREALGRAHEAAYVASVLTASVDAQMARRIGFAITDDIARRASASAGGTLLAARLALQHGLAVNTAGGSHHADRTGGAGFCVFNDVGVAALDVLETQLVRRIAVIDCDVHQGDGTARIFDAEPRVFTFSLHCEDNWPVRKARSDLDIGLPEGTGDAAYLEALSEGLDRVFAAIRPELVFYNAGVDPHADDRLGKLALSDEGLAARDRRVLARCRREGAAVACVIGGGYDTDVEALARRHAGLVHAAFALANTPFR